MIHVAHVKDHPSDLILKIVSASCISVRLSPILYNEDNEYRRVQSICNHLNLQDMTFGSFGGTDVVNLKGDSCSFTHLADMEEMSLGPVFSFM